MGKEQKVALAGKSAFYSNPKWSPDSAHVAFNDNQLNLWDVDVAAGKPRELTRLNYPGRLRESRMTCHVSPLIGSASPPARHPFA